MKKVFFAAFVTMLCFFVSCSNPPATDSKEKMEADKNRANIMEIYKGIESGDMSKMDSILTDDAIDHGSMGDIKSRDSIKKMLSDMHNHVANLKFDVIAEGTATGGGYYFSLVRVTGTTKDNMMGMPANTAMDMNSIDLVKLKDGKFADHWEYDEAKNVMKMMENQKNIMPAKDSVMKK